MNPDDLQQLMMMLQQQQQQQQPQFSAGQAQFGPQPFGSQVKDYLSAGAGALGGAGMAAGMGQGIARPLMQGVGGAFAKQQAPDLRKLLNMGVMGSPRGTAGTSYNMPSQGPGIAGPAGGTIQQNPANQGALVDLIAAIMRKRGQGIAFPPQTSGSQFGMGQGVLTQ